LSTPPSAGFVVRLLATAAAVFLLGASINLAADPNRLWGTGLGSPEPGDARAVKIDVVDRARGVELLLVGDSRGQRLDPRYVTRRTGARTFNGAISGGVSEVQLDVFRRVRRRNPRLRTVVILSGVEAFKPDETPARGPAFDRLFSAGELRRSLEGLLASAGLLRSPQRYRYAADGFELSSPLDYSTSRRLGGPRKTTVILRDQWVDPESAAGVQDFEQLLGEARAAGIRVVLVLMPYHPQTLAANRTLIDAEGPRWHRRLAAIERRMAFELVDFMDPRDAGVEAAGFADPVHMDARNMRELFDRLLGRVPSLRRTGG
jgi:hypothetical protein